MARMLKTLVALAFALIGCTSEPEEMPCVPAHARLDLAPPRTVTLAGLAVQARDIGPAGNDIAVSFVDDATRYNNHIIEDVAAKTVVVHYEPAWTTNETEYHDGSLVKQIKGLFEVGSRLTKLIGVANFEPEAPLQEIEDAFPPTYLTGGQDCYSN
jgi:hypothetical protein